MINTKDSVGYDTVNPAMVVIGAGNGGLALAADLSMKGVPVRLYEHPDFADSFEPVLQRREIVVEDGQSGVIRTPLQLATHDLTEAVADATLVHLAVPVSAHDDYFDALIPVLKADHTLVIWAGRFSSFRCEVKRSQNGCGADFSIVEVNTLPHGSRRVAPGKVTINFNTIVMYAAAGKEDQGKAALVSLQQLFKELKVIENQLEVTFRNSGIPLLGVGALMNIGGIEAKGKDFSLFRDGMSPAVRRAIALTHKEMIAVGAALDFIIPPYSEEIYNGPVSIEGANFRDKDGGIKGFLRLTGPDRLFHRYTIENIAYGLAVIAKLARRENIAVPFIDALCVICIQLCGPEFERLGWSLADLGLE